VPARGGQRYSRDGGKEVDRCGPGPESGTSQYGTCGRPAVKSQRHGDLAFVVVAGLQAKKRFPRSSLQVVPPTSGSLRKYRNDGNGHRQLAHLHNLHQDRDSREVRSKDSCFAGWTFRSSLMWQLRRPFALDTARARVPDSGRSPPSIATWRAPGPS